ncbi:MAG: GNAT family N-acetyltransferase [Desulfomonilaceae bacterium]
MSSEGNSPSTIRLFGHNETFETHCGPVKVCGLCQPDFFRQLKLDAGLGHFSQYSSIIQSLEAFESFSRKKDGRVTLAISDPDVVIGYCVGSYPSPDDRWAALGDLMYELAAIEVSRNYRGCGLGEKLIGVTMSDDFFDNKITYICGYSWHWDLEGKGLTAVQYRSMMKRLYGRFGFREVYTNEPNITLRDENIMMIKVGANVSAEDQLKFRHLRFGIKPKA